MRCFKRQKIIESKITKNGSESIVGMVFLSAFLELFAVSASHWSPSVLNDVRTYTNDAILVINKYHKYLPTKYL